MKLYFILGIFLAFVLVISGVSAVECGDITEIVYADVGSESNVINATFNNSGFYNFNNNSQSYINTNKANYVENGTISVWVKRSGVINPEVIVQRTGGSRPSLKIDSTNKSLFQIYNGTSFFTVYSISNVSETSFDNIVVTWQSNNNLSIYFNGVFEGNTSLYGSVDINSGNWNIGRSSTPTQWFNGSIDELRIYDRVLTRTEISEINESGLNRNESLTNTNLIMWYSFNRGGYVNFSLCDFTSLDNASSQYPNYYEKIGNNFKFYYGLIYDSPLSLLINNSIINFITNGDRSSFIKIYDAPSIIINNLTSSSQNDTFSIETDYFKNRGFYYIYNSSSIQITNSNFSYLGTSYNTSAVFSNKGFKIENSSNINISDSSFSFSVYNLDTKYSSNLRIIGNTFFNATGNTTLHSSHNLNIEADDNFYIADNWFYNNVQSPQGWKSDDSSHIIVYMGGNGLIENNIIHDTENGISLYNHVNNVTISNNTVYNCGGACVKFENAPTNNSLINNTLYSCSTASNNNLSLVATGCMLIDGLASEDTILDSLIEGNTIYDGYRILIQGANVNRTIIRNNLFILNLTNSSFPGGISKSEINSSWELSNNYNTTLSDTSDFTATINSNTLYIKNNLIGNLDLIELEPIPTNRTVYSITNNQYLFTSTTGRDQFNYTLAPNEEIQVSDYSCTVPYEDMTITEDTTFCSGTYYLNGSIVTIDIKTPDVVLDCGGANLYGNITAWGIRAEEDNITIKNCNLNDYRYGILFRNYEGGTAYNNTINNSYYDGINVYNHNNSIIENNSLKNNGITGISVLKDSYNTIIRNNDAFNEGTANMNYGIYVLNTENNTISGNYVYNTTGTAIYIYNDTSSILENNIVRNKLGPYIYYSNNTKIINNTIIGNQAIYSANFVARGSNHLIFENNTISYSQYGYDIVNSYNITLEFNINENLDMGSIIRNSNEIYFQNNTIKNITMSYDGYDLGLKISNSTNIYVLENNFTELASGGVFSQKNRNITIKDNYFTFIKFSDRSNYNARDTYQPPCAIRSSPLYKSWAGGVYVLDNGDTILNTSFYNSDNLTIIGNTFINSQCFLWSDGTININHDFTNYWYRHYQFPEYLMNETEIWINNDFNNLSYYLNGYFDNTFQFRYNNILKANMSISKDYDYVINLNDTITYNWSVFNKTNALIYYSNNSIAGNSNINLNDGNINITLTPNNYSYVLDNFNLTKNFLRTNDPIFNGTSNFMNNTISQVTISVYGVTTISNGYFTSGTSLTSSEFTIPKNSYATLT